MILGIGNDLVDIRRIEKSLQRFGRKFEERIFTDAEIAKADSRAGAGDKVRAAVLAKRFAAKEAFVKALGTGIGEMVGWRDVEIANGTNGAAYFVLHGRTLEGFNAMAPLGMKTQAHLSMTDEYPFAQAFVVISAVISSN